MAQTRDLFATPPQDRSSQQRHHASAIATVLVAAATAVSMPSSSTAIQSLPVGQEFLVSSFGKPLDAAVDVDGDGRFVVVWAAGTVPEREIRWRRYEPDGTPIGSEAVASTATTLDHFDPAVTASPDGTFTIVWTSQPNADGSGSGVFGRHYEADGSPGLGPFVVNQTTVSNQHSPDISSDADGNRVLVWVSNAQDGDGSGVVAALFDSDSYPASFEFGVNSWTTGEQIEPTVAVDPDDGRFIIAWTSDHETDGTGIFGQRFSSLGAPMAGEFQVNTWTTGAQSLPDVTYLDNNSAFTVVWRSNGQDGSGSGIVGRRFSASSGNALGTEFQINTTTTGTQFDPEISSDAIGVANVVWESFGNDGDSYGIFAQQLDRDDSLIGSEMQLNNLTLGPQRRPAVAVDRAGNTLVAWQSDASARAGDRGQIPELRARRLSPPDPPGSLGSEFQVDTYTTYDQENSAVAMREDGSFLVVWERELGSDPNPESLYARGFDHQGTPSGPPVNIVGTMTFAERSPVVVTMASDDFLAVWHDEMGEQIRGRRVAPDGSPIGAEFQVNVLTTGTQDRPSVARLSDDSFVVVWHSDAEGGFDIKGRNLDSSGSPVAGEFVVSASTSSDETKPRVAASPNGEFVAAWRSADQIRVRRFDNQGTPLASDFEANTSTFLTRDSPDTAFLDGGSRFVVSWQGFADAAGSYVPVFRLFDSNDSPLTDEVVISEPGPYDGPARIAPATGGFVVAWSREAYGPEERDVMTRHYDSSGSATSSTQRMNAFRVGRQSSPAVVVNGQNRLVVSWNSAAQDGDGRGVFARRLVRPLFADGFESEDTSSWSATSP